MPSIVMFHPWALPGIRRCSFTGAEVLRLWSVWTVEPEVARSLVRQARGEHAARLTAYEQELADVSADPASRDRADPAFACLVTLEGGVRTRRAAVEWCDWLLAELDHPDGPQPQ